LHNEINIDYLIIVSKISHSIEINTVKGTTCIDYR